jgi:mono/diheme cytochrome c family protein
MKKLLKGVLWFVVLFVVAVGIVAWMGSNRPNKMYNVSVNVPDIQVDSTLLARGEHVTYIWGCRDCHGNNLGGQELSQNTNLVSYIAAPNLTSGQGGQATMLTDEDWVRAIRYGLHTDGKPLYNMPSSDWTAMSDYDVMAVIRYIQAVEPVDNELYGSYLGPLGYVLAGLGQLNMWEAEHIDFTLPPNNSVIKAASVEYGAYIASNCMGCHKPDLRGGKHNDPTFPEVPNITMSGEFGSWSKEQFITALTTGVRPDGRQMSPMQMPWGAFSHMDEVEIDAIYAYLRSQN